MIENMNIILKNVINDTNLKKFFPYCDYSDTNIENNPYRRLIFYTNSYKNFGYILKPFDSDTLSAFVINGLYFNYNPLTDAIISVNSYENNIIKKINCPEISIFDLTEESMFYMLLQK